MMVIFPLFFYIVRKIITQSSIMETYTECILVVLVLLLISLLYLVLYELSTVIVSQNEEIKELKEKLFWREDHIQILSSGIDRLIKYGRSDT